MAVTVWRWPCGGHMNCHVTWKDNPLRVISGEKKNSWQAGNLEFLMKQGRRR